MKLNPRNLPFLLKIDEVAYLLQVTVQTVKRRVKRGEIKAIVINERGDKRFKSYDIVDLIPPRKRWN